MNIPEPDDNYKKQEATNDCTGMNTKRYRPATMRSRDGTFLRGSEHDSLCINCGEPQEVLIWPGSFYAEPLITLCYRCAGSLLVGLAETLTTKATGYDRAQEIPCDIDPEDTDDE